MACQISKLTHDGVRAILRDVGPLTSAEIAEFFPSDSHRNVSSALRKMRLAAIKQIYIHRWTRDIDRGKPVLRAVYCLGGRPDAKRPEPITGKEASQRYRDKKRLPLNASSVFAWAQQFRGSR